MGESISARVGRVLAGGVNKIIDAFESVAPETVLEQTIREIDSAIEDVRTELGKESTGKHLATRRLFEVNKKHDELKEQLQLAVQQNRDDLAETAIARQLDMEAQIPVIEQSIQDFAEREKQLEVYLKALHGRVREMKEEFLSYRRQKETAVSASATSASGVQTSDVSARVQKAEAAFDRMLTRLTGLPGTNEGTDISSAMKLQELEKLTRSHRIQERLAATKAALSEGK